MLALFANSDALVIDFRIVGCKQIARAVVDRAGRIRILLRAGSDDNGHGKPKPDSSDAWWFEQAHSDRLSCAI
jgi:hypothetical protein